jgi:hypothetical protein
MKQSPVVALAFLLLGSTHTFATVIVNGSFESGSIVPWFQNTDGVRPPLFNAVL